MTPFPSILFSKHRQYGLVDISLKRIRHLANGVKVPEDHVGSMSRILLKFNMRIFYRSLIFVHLWFLKPSYGLIDYKLIFVVH